MLELLPNQDPSTFSVSSLVITCLVTLGASVLTAWCFVRFQGPSDLERSRKVERRRALALLDAVTAELFLIAPQLDSVCKTLKDWSGERIATPRTAVTTLSAINLEFLDSVRQIVAAEPALDISVPVALGKCSASVRAISKILADSAMIIRVGATDAPPDPAWGPALRAATEARTQLQQTIGLLKSQRVMLAKGELLPGAR